MPIFVISVNQALIFSEYFGNPLGSSDYLQSSYIIESYHKITIQVPQKTALEGYIMDKITEKKIDFWPSTVTEKPLTN